MNKSVQDFYENPSHIKAFEAMRKQNDGRYEFLLRVIDLYGVENISFDLLADLAYDERPDYKRFEEKVKLLYDSKEKQKRVDIIKLWEKEGGDSYDKSLIQDIVQSGDYKRISFLNKLIQTYGVNNISFKVLVDLKCDKTPNYYKLEELVKRYYNIGMRRRDADSEGR